MKLHGYRKYRKNVQRIVSILLVACMAFSGSSAYHASAEGADEGQGSRVNDHEHTESCYETALVCGMEEYAGGIGEQILICAMPEGEGHVHTPDCCAEDGTVVCGLEEQEGHAHTDSCYAMEEVQESHAHTESCHDHILICGREENAAEEEADIQQPGDADQETAPAENGESSSQETGTENSGEAAVGEGNAEAGAHQEVTEADSAQGEETADEESLQNAQRIDTVNQLIAAVPDRAEMERLLSENAGNRENWYQCLGELGSQMREACRAWMALDAQQRAQTEGMEELLGLMMLCREMENSFLERPVYCGKESHLHRNAAGCYNGDGILNCEKEEHIHDDSCFRIPGVTEEEQAAVEKANILLADLPAAEEIRKELETYEEGQAAYAECLSDTEERCKEARSAYDAVAENVRIHIAGGEKLTEMETLLADLTAEMPDTEPDADSEEQTSCGKAEHTHTEDCLDRDGNSICETEEHSHTGECFLTEEERAQIAAVKELIAVLPSEEEIMQRMAEMEGTEDEDAWAVYMIALTGQITEACEAYEALRPELRQYVEGAAYLILLSGILEGVTLETNEAAVMGEDEAYVNSIIVTSMTTGTAPFDAEEGRGNDTTADDKIVRTFDSVTYNFSVNMKSWDIKQTFREARVKLEFVLPRTEGEAVFDQSAMTWMDTAEGYAPKLTTETRIIDGKETECQVLTCYKRLLPAEGSLSVVPGDFGENLTIYVRSMHNGETFAPIISAAMEGGTWEGGCENEEHKDENGQPVMEKKSVTPELVTVTAAPRYNVKLDSESSYRGVFDFQGDEEWMNKYESIAANTNIATPIPGRLMKLGVTLQLYNAENPAKGLKGIELPKGPISFDLDVSSVYTPTATSEQGTTIDTTQDYTPLLWSYGENREIQYGKSNTDGRVLYERNGCLELAPYFEHNEDREGSDCWDSGTWKAVQEGSTIRITVEDYEINLDHMPTKNLPGGADLYGKNIGCFSTGGIWLLQPFNKKESETDVNGPEYDVVKDHGAGAFATTAEVKNLKGTTESDEPFQEGTDGFQQAVSTDDREVRTLELNLPGAMQNRVRYAGDHDRWWLGSGVDDIYDGNDYATVGDELYLVGGFSYDSKKNDGNQLYLGTNLLRFYGSAIELTGEGASNLVDGASLDGKNGQKEGDQSKGSMAQWWEPDPVKSNIRIYYAVKADGTDWADDWEMQHTHEAELQFYDSLESIPAEKVCVGILTCFIGPGPLPETDTDSGSYYYYHKAKVRENKDLAGKSFALVSTSRVWTREMFEQAGKALSDICLGTEQEANILDWIMEANMLEDSHYKSANIDGSVWYTREEYKEDGSGALGKHNSEWEHWGDTLLIIGYRTSITKHLMQKVANGEEKKNFNLDAGQRVADFMLQPRTYYEKQGQYNHTAPITIVDTLPRNMTYKPGTAYFGGQYQQTSTDGGTKGNIVTDTAQGAAFPEPVLTEPQVVNNEDGTQTLTWVIPDVKIGEPMAPIYYSVDIGNADPAKDVPVGTTDLKNTVYITAPEDLRDPLKTAEKHSEAGIAVNRGSASSFGKYTKQKVVEEDGEIDYVIYFNNNADTPAELTVMDTMPASGINGSEFTGTYAFAEWKLDITKCDMNKLKIYYTFEEEYKNKTTREVDKAEIEGTKEGSSGKWIETMIYEDGTIQIPEPQEGKENHPTAWAVTGTLDSAKSVYIDLKIKLDPGPSAPDRDKSNYFVNLLSKGDTTTITENPTVRRTLEGLAWMDYDRDGVQGAGEDEPRIDGVQVELLKLKEGVDAEGNPWNPEKDASYENVCFPDTDDPIVVRTGYQISVRAGSAKDAVLYKPQVSGNTNGEAGHYKFLDLPAGTFAVRFTDESGNPKISKLNPTRSNVGTDDTKDSDGIPAYGDDGKLRETVIFNLPMPTAEEMSVSLYESKYHDSGFYPDTLMAVQKVDDEDKRLAGAVFTVQNAQGETLTFTCREGEGYYLKGYEKRGTSDGTADLQETTRLTADENGKLNIRNLLPGDYTITEVEAPQGYTLLGEPVAFALKMNGMNSYIELRGHSADSSMVSLETAEGNPVQEGVPAVCLKIKNNAMYRLPSTGGPGTGAYAAAGALLMTISAAYVFLLRRKRNSETMQQF